MNGTSKTIEITIEPDGQAKVETKGFMGASCRDASRFIEQALGKAVSEQLTAEFHQNAENKQSIRQHDGTA